MRSLVLLFLAASLSFFSINTYAINQPKNPVSHLKNILSVSAREEVADGNCIGITVAGKCMEWQTREYLTTPLSLNIQETKSVDKVYSKGSIVYTFRCRMRKQNHIPKGAPAYTTKDTHYNGGIKADYIMLEGDISIKNIRREGGVGRCGNVITERLDDF